MKQIIGLTFLILCLSFWTSYAVDNRVQSAYSKFSRSIENKYSSDKQHTILKSVRERVWELIEANRFSSSTLSLLQDLEALNNEAMYDRWLESETDQSVQVALENRLGGEKDKLPFSELSWEFQWFFTPNVKTQEKAWVYYGYNFNNFRYYNDPYGVYERDLQASGFERSSDYIYRGENGRYNFITDITEQKLVSREDIFWLPDKHLVLDALREDSKFPTSDMSDTLSQIATISKNLSRWKSKREATQAIYGWILENISYSTNFNLSDEKIFSAIETFKNKQWVCTGYTKLMLYMLSFAGVYDVEVIRGQVIDASDFPKIGHAWIRIGDKYYDPTFDDPVWAVDTKTPSEYTYYWLPKDIFYANRFEYADLPEWFENKSELEIRQYIFNYLSQLLPKYEWQEDYDNVFAPIKFRLDNNISPLTIITPDILAQKIGFYSSDDTFRYQKNGEMKQINNIKYFVIDDQSTEQVLKQLQYDADSLTLFNWQTESWAQEWRLAYKLDER